MRYWIACSVVTVIITLVLFTITEYFYIYSIVLMGIYTGIGICHFTPYCEKCRTLGKCDCPEEKIPEEALQDENQVVE